jgi:hypothetical protein
MTRGLTIVSPLTITDAMVTSDVPEDDYDEWDTATVYTAGDRVISLDTHMIYEAIHVPTVYEWIYASFVCIIESTATDSVGALEAGGEIPVLISGTETLPTGLVAGTVYYARTLTPGQTFALYDAPLPGGSLITPTGGSGTWYVEMIPNVGFDPADSANVGNYWAEVSPTNLWSAFDGRSSSQTAKATSMYFEITPGVAVGSLYAGNVSGCTSMRVRLTDPDYGVAYDETVTFGHAPVSASWWHWFFGVRRAPLSAVLTDLPSLPNAVLRVDFTGTADLAVGVLLIGQPNRFGSDFGVLQGASSGIQDYSRRETDDFGNVNLVRRAYAPKARWRVVVPNREVGPLQNYLAELRATPVLFIGSEDLEPLIVFGFYKNFDILFSYAHRSECDLEIEGLP